MKMENFRRLERIIANAYALALQVQDDNRDERILQSLAEEVSGECAEFLALLNGEFGSFDSEECMDAELVGLADELRGH
jgi:hypothetical protein